MPQYRHTNDRPVEERLARLRELAGSIQLDTSDYQELERKLNAEGFHARIVTIIAPLQIDGQLPTGEAFYFRCRHDTCSLAVAPAGKDPVLEPSWESEIDDWEDEDASMLSVEEAEATLKRLVERYQQEVKGNA